MPFEEKENHTTYYPEKKPVSAIDPDTGEINWDCPCLEAALKPPCGELFKKAFACFVKSETEPKGEDCVKFFVDMQKLVQMIRE